MNPYKSAQNNHFGHFYRDNFAIQSTFNSRSTKYDVTSSRITDFRIGDNIFEVGGEKKGAKQLQGEEGGYVVRDDIEYGFNQIIPLWHFGLTY